MPFREYTEESGTYCKLLKLDERCYPRNSSPTTTTSTLAPTVELSDDTDSHPEDAHFDQPISG
jgi:hypothetical protein